MIKSIYAVDLDGGFSHKGKLPWGRNEHVEQDLVLFREMTLGHVVLMGHHTYKSLPKKGLPERTIVVLSLLPPSEQKTRKNIDRLMTGDICSILNYLQECYPKKDIWVIGGKNVFEQALPYIQEQYISFIQGKFEADIKIDISKMIRDYQEIDQTVYRNSMGGINFIQKVYTRIGV